MTLPMANITLCLESRTRFFGSTGMEYFVELCGTDYVVDGRLLLR